jgi:hypothetical protein
MYVYMLCVRVCVCVWVGGWVLRNVTLYGHRTWTDLSNDLSNGKWTRDLDHGLLGVSIGQAL